MKTKIYLRKIIVSLVLSLPTSLLAYMHPDPGCLALQAQFLYLYPAFGGEYFVVNTTQPSANTSFSTGNRITNELGYVPAFRVEGFYNIHNSCQDFRLNWTYLHAQRSATLSGGRLIATENIPELASGVTSYIGGYATDIFDVIYQSIEALFEHKMLDRNCCEIYFQAGLQYLYTRFNQDVRYRNNIQSGFQLAFDFVDYKGRAYGVGPEIGLESNWQLCSFQGYCPGDFSLTLGGTYAFLIGATKSSVKGMSASVPIYLMKDKTTWRGIPSFHTFLGCNYAACFKKRYPVSLEIGYEITYYSDCVSQLRPYDDSNRAASLNYYKSLTLHGPYASLGVSF